MPNIHDVNQAVANIRSLAYAGHNQTDPRAQRETVERILNECVRAQPILNDLCEKQAILDEIWQRTPKYRPVEMAAPVAGDVR